MPAYIILETPILDAEQLEIYQPAMAAAAVAVEAGGGRFIASGGEVAVLDGDWHPKRLVLLEFPDLEATRRFHESRDYQKAKQLREGLPGLNMVAVDGLA